MASVKRRPRSKFWVACYRLPDGTRRQRTTKTTDKAAALRLALASERAARQRLTADAARKMIADVLTSINEDASGLIQEPAGTFFDRWQARRSREVGKGTGDRYKQILDDFRAFAGATSVAGALASISPALISRYRDNLAGRFATTTANLYLKVLRSAFADAAREGIIPADPAARVRPLKESREAKTAAARRALSKQEIRRILAATSPADEWRGIILAGIYTGQRLGDIANMRRADIARGWWRFTARKTGASMAIPLAKPFVEWLQKRKSTDKTCVFHNAAARVAAAQGKTGTLSNQFHAILARAGLVERRAHKSTGKGRSSPRSAGTLSFHSLRHTTTTKLKVAGVPESVAMAIIGHSSRSISQHYTHLPESALSEAMKKLVDS